MGLIKALTWAIMNDYEYVALFNNDAVASKDWLKTWSLPEINHNRQALLPANLRMDKKHTDNWIFIPFGEYLFLGEKPLG